MAKPQWETWANGELQALCARQDADETEWLVRDEQGRGAYLLTYEEVDDADNEMRMSGVLQPLDARTFDHYLKRVEDGQALEFHDLDLRQMTLDGDVSQSLDRNFLLDCIQDEVRHAYNERENINGVRTLDANTPDEKTFTVDLDRGIVHDTSTYPAMHLNVISDEAYVICDGTRYALQEWGPIGDARDDASTARWCERAKTAFEDVWSQHISYEHGERLWDELGARLQEEQRRRAPYVPKQTPDAASADFSL